MSVGKYSPLCPHADEPGWDAYKFNCYGEVPNDWDQAAIDRGVVYDPKTMFGNYVGIGDGIDRYGYTEMEYLLDSINGGELHAEHQCGYFAPMTSFIRNR